MAEPFGIAAAAALLACGGLVVVGWVFFRRPGVPLWVARAPVWRAADYLTTVGVVLWVAALPALVAGVALLVLASRT